MRSPNGCSWALVTLPMRVSEFSLMRLDVSTVGALIRFMGFSVACMAGALPLSAAERSLVVIGVRRGWSSVCCRGSMFVVAESFVVAGGGLLALEE